MSTVPYIFAGDTGNIPLSQLDANFANAKSAADYVIANVQANITGVGVLANLSVTGNINGTGSTFYTGNGRLLTGIQATTIGVLEELSVIGNITGGNVSAIGNIRTGNIRTTGQVSAFGNVTGSYIKGNGAFLTGIVTSFNANLLTGNTLSGNVIFSNLTSLGTLTELDVSGLTTVTDLYGDYLNSTTVQAIDVFTDYVQANVRVDVGGEISASGNVTATRYFGNGQALTGIIATTVGTLPSLNVTGNIQAGNLVTSGNLVMGGRINVAGNVSAVGNITGNYILGNGALLTGVTGGTSNAALLTGSTLSANVTQSSLTTVGTLNSLSVTGNINMSGSLRDNNELNILTTANNANIVFTPNGTGQVQVDSGLVVSGAINSATTISAAGNITTTGFFVGNFVGNIVANITNIPGPGGAVVYNDGAGNAAATAGLVYTTGPNALTILGNLVSDFVIANGIQGPLTTASQPNITTVGTLTTLSATGNITTTANIAGGFILGDGSQLTGIGTGTSNAALLTGNTLSANVVNSSLTSVGTLTAVNTSGAVSATGNINGGNLNISGNIVDTGALTIITGTNGNIALAPGGTGIVTTTTAVSVAGNIDLSGSIRDSTQLDIVTTGVNTDINLTPTGNVQVSSNLSVAGNIIAPNLVGSGLGTPTISSTTNLVLSAVGAVQVSGNLTASGTVSVAGNITAGAGGFLLGDGSLISNLAGGSYNNSNVTSLMAAFGPNVISSTGNITTTANIAGNYFIGNGALLTGISASGSSYTNANVASFLAAFGSNVISSTGNITTTANIASGNLSGWQLFLDPPVGSGGGGGIVFNNSFSEIYYNTITSGMDVVAKAGPLYLWGTGNSVNRGVKFITDGGTAYYDYTGNLTLPNTLIANGNIQTGGNISLTGNIVDTGALSIVTGSNGNINLVPNGTGIVTTSSALSVAGNVTANNFVGGGAGTPTLSSATNLDLSAATAVRVTGGGTFRLPSLSTAQIANIVAVNGDLIYNTTVNKIQGFENGVWGNLI